MSRCPICGVEVVQPKTGRPRVYCSQSHRQMAYERRHRRPLGHKHVQELGIGDLSRALREIGVLM